MSIIIIGDSFSFPDGDAATNRVHTYAKGLCENGVKSHVICFASEYNTRGDGTVNGIYFYHPFQHRERSNNFITRQWHKSVKYLNTIHLFRRINKEERIDAVIVYTALLSTHLFAWFLARINKTIIIKECGEHPLRNHQKGCLKVFQGKIKVRIEAFFSDGIFCISQYLISFFKNLGISGKKLFQVPSTVDTERFKTSFNPPLDYKYILYCGGLTIIKDGVDILIESFKRISDKFPDINLVLIGRGDTPDEEKILRELPVKLGIDKRVVFPGFLSRTEIPAYLTNAGILALARPKSIIADAGFPSKVTEYLSTGVPVVVTEVGEIPVYLKDSENAFLVEPGNAGAFAEKLEYVLRNYEFAREVGKRGRDTAETVFNYKYQAKRIIEFVRSF